MADDKSQIVDLLHTLPEAPLESITESLASLPAANELQNQTLGREIWLLLLAQQAVPCGQCQREDMTSTMEPLDPANAREGQREAITRGSCAVGLSSPVGRGAQGTRRQEASWLCGKAQESFTEMQTSRIAIACTVDLIRTVSRARGIR